jgi:hypothetical protein
MDDDEDWEIAEVERRSSATGGSVNAVRRYWRTRSSVDQLAHRVELLEQRVVELERRLGE